jgi:dihydrofolate synthase/folylpolyglutamate synthase
MVYLPHWPIPSTFGKRQLDYEAVFERCAPVLEKLGNPHKKLPPIIHIAGTNGKGSATALFSEIFRQAGYRVHTYISPHLHESNERIVLDSQKISDSFLYEIMEETRIAAIDANLTFMEGFTCGAFLAFSKIPADILVLECGMGGRIDITNIIEEKILSVIMPISFDHVEYLGNSIERIALEKAMIMRPNCPLVVAAQPQEAKNIIKILADDQKIPAYFYDEDFAIQLDEDSGEFDFQFQETILENLPKPALLGIHQYINFSTVLAGILAIKDQFKIDESHLRQAIKKVFWPSRLEKVTNGLNRILNNPNSEIWIDGAHNSAGAFALARWIKDQDQEKQNFVICGFSRNKCKKEFLENFKGIANLIAVLVNGEPYAENPEIITKIAAEIDMQAPPFIDLGEAVFYIKNKVKDQPCRIVICGSLHLARDVRSFSSFK